VASGLNALAAVTVEDFLSFCVAVPRERETLYSKVLGEWRKTKDSKTVFDITIAAIILSNNLMRIQSVDHNHPS